MRKILMIIFLLIFLVGCKDNLNVKCCEQCSNGATQDVRGMDINLEPCLNYKNSNLVDTSGKSIELISSECVEYFEENQLTVSDCSLN